MGDARLTVAAAVAIGRALAGGVEGLPRNPGRVVDPRLFRLRVAAGRVALLHCGAACLAQSCVDLGQLGPGFYLDAEMVEPLLLAARGNREIDARIIEHPF